MQTPTYLGGISGALAASTAAFARPWRASIGAVSADLGRVSSGSFSPSDGAVFGMTPYVAYLCGWDNIK